ncbi:MAG TPA: CIA30 family protein [Candidatus Angelobacter sp.]|nr:CIA30 family protein [Candidatus Angelobacter sp.]
MSAKYFHTRSFALTVVAFLMSSALTSVAQTSPQTGNEFVIRNVRIFDGSHVIPQGNVWVQGGLIKAVGPNAHVPAAVRSIDGSGDTLLPGLIDAHTHDFGDALRQALINGVTTDLDMFTNADYARSIKKEQSEGKDLDRADLRSAGTLVTAPHGHGTEYGMPIPTISSPTEAQSFVDARLAEGSDYIKIVYDDGKTYGMSIPTISKETMAAVVAAAHKRGKLAVVHIGSLQGAKDAIQAGADGLAHLFVDQAPDAEFISLAESHHVFVVPTLSVLAAISHYPAAKSLAADSHLQPYLTTDMASSLAATFPRESGKFGFAQATVNQLHSRHVLMLAGTDAPNPGTAHGASLHGELELLASSGLTPTEALIAATSAPAAAFRLSDRGQIAPGKRADLVLVKGDPTVDITATRNIVSVWKLGVEADRAAFRAAVEKQKQELAAQKGGASPAGSESGLISDFDDSKPSANFGFGWQISTDGIMGGKSTAQMRVVEGGAEGTKGALQVEGEVIAGSPASWAGAIFFPGSAPMTPVNLSSKKAISFWAKGDGKTFAVMVFAKAHGFQPSIQTIAVNREWSKITLPLNQFNTDGSDLMGIFFGATAEPGRFTLSIDNVRLE